MTGNPLLQVHDVRVLLVGAGGLGSPAALTLARAGVRHFTIVDDDCVEVSNLHRQVIHRTEDAGRPKVESAADAIHCIAANAIVQVHKARFDERNAAELIHCADVVIDGSDNFPTHFLLNDACVRSRVPFVHGAAIRWQGQLLAVDPRRGDPCYRCLFETLPPPEVACGCAEAGVVGPMVGVIGALQAEAALALACSPATAANERLGTLIVYDGRAGSVRAVRFRTNPRCPVCHRANDLRPASAAGAAVPSSIEVPAC